MNFFSTVDIAPSSHKITHQDELLTLGSCFSENIGAKLANAFFTVNINPFGVLYNPYSILQSLEYLLENRTFSVDDIFLSHGLWHSFAHSSKFSQVDRMDTLHTINSTTQSARKVLKRAKYLLITFGTAYVYSEKENGGVVANCHKLPAEKFERRMLSVEEIVNRFEKIYEKIKTFNPEIHMIFTVSPVRHWKDGANRNNLSKSVLHLSIDEIVQKNRDCHYFPAYEIQMDELRDYRFYATDTFHPNDVAIAYIWQRFSETFFNAKTMEIIRELEAFRKDLNHRPLHIGSEAYQKFVAYLGRKYEQLTTKYDFLKTYPKKSLFVD